MPSPNLVRAAQRIEELPTDDGSVLDTLTGAILRIFVRLIQLEAMNARLVSRVAALEGSGTAEDGVRENGPRRLPL